MMAFSRPDPLRAHETDTVRNACSEAVPLLPPLETAAMPEPAEGRRPLEGTPWTEIQPHGTRPRLYLVHGVGGGMLWGYANLARHLGTDQPVFAFKACDPVRLAELDTIEKLAAHFVRELRRLQPAGPYSLGGYCFGGNVAYEMARLLDLQGERVSLLALMNSSPPNSSYDRMSWTPRFAWLFLRNLGHWVQGFVQWGPVKQGRFLRWKIGGVRKRAAQWFRRKPGRTAGPDVESMVDLSAVPEAQRCLWESHVQALTRHHTRPYGGRVILLRTRGHPLNCSYDGQCGWGELALGGVAVQVIPGLHESLLEEPFVGAVARELRIHLEAVQAQSGKTS